MTIQEAVTTTIKSTDLPHLDVETILAYTLKKSREFILMYPEYKLTASQQQKFERLIQRRTACEPVAYIVGHKEFYGLDFIVDKSTLIPRPETELMVENVITLLRSMLRSKLRNIVVADIGTGSGCIITSVVHTMCHPEFISGSSNAYVEIPKQVRNDKFKYFAVDISKEALTIARKNAKNHGADKKIKFLQGDLLTPLFKEASSKNYSHILENIGMSSLIITANLPYLSKEIYQSAAVDVKKFEPKSALYSPKAGLAHYEKLLQQIQKLKVKSKKLKVDIFLEISPEQKKLLSEMIKKILPLAKISFTKDLAGRWRVCKIDIAMSS